MIEDINQHNVQEMLKDLIRFMEHNMEGHSEAYVACPDPRIKKMHLQGIQMFQRAIEVFESLSDGHSDIGEADAE